MEEAEINRRLQAEKKQTRKVNEEDDEPELAIDKIDEIMDSPEKRIYSGKASVNKTDETSNVPRSEGGDDLNDDY